MKPDVRIAIRLRTAEEGGRSTPISDAFDYYGCPLMVDGLAFDCRIPLSESLALGESYVVDVAFLSPALAMPHMEVGKQIQLWEGRLIADGWVEAIR